MGGGQTRHTAHAAQGRTRLRKTVLERPDTVVHLPGGETLTLRRSAQEVMPLFRKLDPKKFDVRSGKLHSRKKKGGKADQGGVGQPRGGGRWGLPALSSIPVSRIVVTAVLAHQVFNFLNTTVLRWWRRRRNGGAAAGANRQEGRAVSVWNGGNAEVWDEEDLDEEGRLKLAAARKAQAEMARAMLRGALPKQTRQSLPQRAAAAHASRPRPVPSAKQRTQPSKGVKQRTKGKLEKMDDAVQRGIRAALHAARSASAREQQQQALQGPSSAKAPLLLLGPSGSNGVAAAN